VRDVGCNAPAGLLPVMVARRVISSISAPMPPPEDVGAVLAPLSHGEGAGGAGTSPTPAGDEGDTSPAWFMVERLFCFCFAARSCAANEPRGGGGISSSSSSSMCKWEGAEGTCRFSSTLGIRMRRSSSADGAGPGGGGGAAAAVGAPHDSSGTSAMGGGGGGIDINVATLLLGMNSGTSVSESWRGWSELMGRRRREL
jgi:hypothetical protein